MVLLFILLCLSLRLDNYFLQKYSALVSENRSLSEMLESAKDNVDELVKTGNFSPTVVPANSSSLPSNVQPNYSVSRLYERVHELEIELLQARKSSETSSEALKVVKDNSERTISVLRDQVSNLESEVEESNRRAQETLRELEEQHTSEIVSLRAATADDVQRLRVQLLEDCESRILDVVKESKAADQEKENMIRRLQVLLSEDAVLGADGREIDSQADSVHPSSSSAARIQLFSRVKNESRRVRELELQLEKYREDLKTQTYLVAELRQVIERVHVLPERNDMISPLPQRSTKGCCCFYFLSCLSCVVVTFESSLCLSVFLSLSFPFSFCNFRSFSRCL